MSDLRARGFSIASAPGRNNWPMTNCYSQYMMHGLHAKECLTIDNAPVQLRPLSTVAQYFHLAWDTLSTVYGIGYLLMRGAGGGM